MPSQERNVDTAKFSTVHDRLNFRNLAVIGANKVFKWNLRGNLNDQYS